jgi:hypothetical protein
MKSKLHIMNLGEKKHPYNFPVKRGGRTFLLSLLCVFIFSIGYSQTMSISTGTVTVTPQAGTVLDLSQNPGKGTTAGAVPAGFLLPILTSTQMNNISASAPAGLLLFNSTINCYEIYSGSVWNPFWCLCTVVPSVTAGALSTSICTGSTINLTATGSASTYTWTGPNGFTSTQQNPSITNVTLAAAGTYSVTGSNGCGSSAISTVTISVAAGTPVTAGVAASPVCSGATIDLTCTLVGGATYSWTGPNGFTSTAQNPTITNATTAASGTYTVTVTEGTCDENSTVAVVVNPTPGTPSNIIAIDSNTGVAYVGPCSGGCIAVGQTLIYSVTNVAGVTFTWAVANGNIISGQNTNTIHVQWNAAGTNEITVFETQNTCTGPINSLYVKVSATCSCTYGCGSSGSFTVPAGIHSVSLNLSGAEGGATYIGMTVGSGGAYGAQPETWGQATYGANLTCKYAASPGSVLNCYGGCVGGNGTSSVGGAGGTGGLAGDEAGGAGLFWGGAATGTGGGGGVPWSANQYLSASGGGGGGSSVRLNGTAFANIIAAAGGGGGNFVHWDWACADCQLNNGNGGCHDGGNVGGVIENNDYQAGFMYAGTGNGCGGNTTGATGGSDIYGFGTEGGGGGTTAAGGAGAAARNEKTLDLTNCVTTTAGAVCPGSAGGNGGLGSNGIGGNAGFEGFYSEYATCEYGPGGGGGGGYYGGGGGCGGGGGGGSSYAGGAGITVPVYIQCSQSGNGFVIVTW